MIKIVINNICVKINPKLIYLKVKFCYELSCNINGGSYGHYMYKLYFIIIALIQYRLS